MARKSRGKFIVFEGIDGSGKTTQVKLLLNYLKNPPAHSGLSPTGSKTGGKIPFVEYSFPRYDKPWGMMVSRYLDGEFGSVDGVNPYLASVLYAGDRFAAASEIRDDLKTGKVVICDRYVASNIAHQASKIKNQISKTKYIEWLEDFEYRQNGIFKEDLVILFSVPPQISQKLMSAKKKDIHESDGRYLAKVADVYNQLAKDRKNWVKINCVAGGKLKEPQQIFREVLSILQKRDII